MEQLCRRVVANGSRFIHSKRRCCSVFDDSDDDDDELLEDLEGEFALAEVDKSRVTVRCSMRRSKALKIESALCCFCCKCRLVALLARRKGDAKAGRLPLLLLLLLLLGTGSVFPLMRFAGAVLGRILGRACFTAKSRSTAASSLPKVESLAPRESCGTTEGSLDWEDPVSNFSTEERPIGGLPDGISTAAFFSFSICCCCFTFTGCSEAMAVGCTSASFSIWSATPIRRYEYASSSSHSQAARPSDEKSQSSRSCCCELRLLLLPEAPELWRGNKGLSIDDESAADEDEEDDDDEEEDEEDDEDDEDPADRLFLGLPLAS